MKALSVVDPVSLNEVEKNRVTETDIGLYVTSHSHVSTRLRRKEIGLTSYPKTCRKVLSRAEAKEIQEPELPFPEWPFRTDALFSLNL